MGRIIRVDGTEEGCPFQEDMGKLLGSRTGGCDVVILRHLGEPLQVMMVDDTGFIDERPVNEKATALYHRNCIPGTAHPICGDVWVGYDHEAA